MTLLGTTVTVIGIGLCLSFPFAPAAFGKGPSDEVVNGSVDIQLSMRWIQPILGQAIMEDALIRQQYGTKMGDAIRRDGWKLPAQAFAAQAEEIEVDHLARVQWVMGRLIVNLTSHQVQAGLSAADRLANEGNHRIIAIAQQAGMKWDDAFKMRWQANIGQAIVTNALTEAPPTEQTSERIGLTF